MNDRQLVAFYQYYLFRGDRLKEDCDNALHYLIKNKFTFDYDIMTAYKAIIKKDFFEEIFKDLFELMDL